MRIQDDLAVDGDPFLLRRAVGNLLDNAVEFTAPAALADADAPSDGAADIVITLAREGRMARIAVRDLGPGVPPYAQGRLFDKFFSLARPGSQKKSTGLGLSFVREIATLHQGSVEVGNAVARRGPGDPARTDRGALAVLRLPAVKTG